MRQPSAEDPRLIERLHVNGHCYSSAQGSDPLHTASTPGAHAPGEASVDQSQLTRFVPWPALPDHLPAKAYTEREGPKWISPASAHQAVDQLALVALAYHQEHLDPGPAEWGPGPLGSRPPVHT